MLPLIQGVIALAQLLLFITKQIAYPHDGIDLFLRQSRQQIPPN